jgi:hypothetical protein
VRGFAEVKMNAQQRRDEDSSPAADASTLAGTIRWFALAIGIACLALLTLVGNLAHAATPGPGGCAAAMTGAYRHAHGAAYQTPIDGTREGCVGGPFGAPPAPTAPTDRADTLRPVVVVGASPTT